jgi:hypothetical protein
VVVVDVVVVLVVVVLVVLVVFIVVVVEVVVVEADRIWIVYSSFHLSPSHTFHGALLASMGQRVSPKSYVCVCRPTALDLYQFPIIQPVMYMSE